MSDGARYAVWAALDSANDTRNPAENDHYRGAFVVFARFAIICRDVRSPEATGYGSARPGNADHEGRQMAAKWLNLESNWGRRALSSVIAGQQCPVRDFQRWLSKQPALLRLILFLGPCDVAGDEGHDRDAETADQKLRQR
jgi:hypothetical protein